MICLRQGRKDDAFALSRLIYSSAPDLLPYLFDGEANALSYLMKACGGADGQYSASRHTLATVNVKGAQKCLACMTLWSNDMPASFHVATLNSLTDFLSHSQIQHLLNINPLLSQVFRAPLKHQLCIGHLAVDKDNKGQGIGKKLIAYAIKQARLMSKTTLVLDVDKQNDEALNFYLNCNFKSVTESVFKPSDQTFLRLHYRL